MGAIDTGMHYLEYQCLNTVKTGIGASLPAHAGPGILVTVLLTAICMHAEGNKQFGGGWGLRLSEHQCHIKMGTP